ncbi:MAG TPA: YkgJ family cysteine cluster protein [Stellaceae bacterium]|nr:YkgJ family cysteine cluster protein [Stellaceae bacterium]
MTSLQRRPIADIGIRIPDGITLPIAPELVTVVTDNAELARATGLALIEAAVARNPAMKLVAILTVLKLIAFARSDQNPAVLAQHGATIECAAGCAACCHQMVEATIPEAILVAMQIGGEEDPRRAAIQAEAQAHLRDGQRSPARPCALLSDNRCSVYEVRPLVCRSVLSPSAGKCREALASAQRGEASPAQSDIYEAPLLLSRGDQAGLRGICKDLGLQHDVVRLAETVAAILGDPSTVDRWLAGEAVFTATTDSRVPEPA